MSLALVGKVIWHNQARIQLASADGLAQFFSRGVVSMRLKDQAFSESRNQFAAFRGATVIDDTELQILKRRIQRQPEQDDVQRRRNDQQHNQTTVAPDLVKLFDEKRPEPQVKNSVQWFHASKTIFYHSPSPFGRGLGEGLVRNKTHPFYSPFLCFAPSPLAPLPEGDGNSNVKFSCFYLHLFHHAPRAPKEKRAQQSKCYRRRPNGWPTSTAQKRVANHFQVVAHRHDVRQRAQWLRNVRYGKDVTRQQERSQKPAELRRLNRRRLIGNRRPQHRSKTRIAKQIEKRRD